MLISQTSALCQGPDSHLLLEQGKKEATAMRLPAKEGLTSHLYPQGMTGGSRQGPLPPPRPLGRRGSPVSPVKSWL